MNTKDIKAIIIGLIFAGGALVASAAWTAPGATPPNNNAYPPINVSSANQAKAVTQTTGQRGGLGVGTFSAASDASFFGDIYIDTFAGGTGVAPVCVDTATGALTLSC